MAEQAVENPAKPVRALSQGYIGYALGMLLLVNFMNYMDRMVINIIAEPIKEELGLYDWQLGVLTGIAFAIFYSVLALPIAKLAERSNRPLIIAASLAVWSGFTAVCGLAQNFFQLLLARIGVGAGEAGCLPPAHSLVSDYVPRNKRASALSLVSMGAPLGSVVGMAIGGVIADAYGWRMAFFVCGLPGIALAVVVALTLIEPRARQAAEALKAQTAKTHDDRQIREAFQVLRKKRTFWLFSLAGATKAFIGYGAAPFLASFFFRNHRQELTDLGSEFGLQAAGFLGVLMGVVNGLGGAIGTFLGGYLADRYGAKDYRAYATIPAIGSLVVIPIFIGIVLAPSVLAAIPFMFFSVMLSSLWNGPTYVTAQSIVPAHMRATSTAILLFIINLIGLGLGPLAIGALSDFYAIGLGMGSAEGVRWALISGALLGVVAAALFWLARGPIRDELEG